MELKITGARLRLHTLIAVIQDLVELLHQADIDCELEIRFFEFIPVELHTVAFGHRYVEMLQQVAYCLVVQLQLLLKQTHHHLIHLVNRLVDNVLAQVLKCRQFMWV